MDYSIAIVLGVCGVIAAAIGYSKHRSVIVCFLLGALLGAIGIFIAWVLPRGAPKAPPGFRAVKCANCYAVQNIPEADTTFECGQCKRVSEAADKKKP